MLLRIAFMYPPPFVFAMHKACEESTVNIMLWKEAQGWWGGSSDHLDDEPTWYKSSVDGTSWASDQRAPKVSTSSDPSAVQYNGKVFVIHQGGGNNGELWYDVLDGGSWARDVKFPMWD